MSESEHKSTDALCNYCRKYVVKSIKCEKCCCTYHPSCAQRQKGIKILSESALICCGNENIENFSENSTKDPVMLTRSKVSINVESSKYDLLINIIQKLEESDKLLMENKDLLQEKIYKLENDISVKNIEIDRLKKQITNSNIEKKSEQTIKRVEIAHSKTSE